MSGEKKANDESWAAAHEVSQKLVLQAAIQDVEKKAVKLDEDLTISLKENEKQSEVLKTMQRKIDELEASLRSESTKLRAVQNDFERSSSALESMRLAEKEKEARFDRLQRESDALRDEIGLVLFAWLYLASLAAFFLNRLSVSNIRQSFEYRKH